MAAGAAGASTLPRARASVELLVRGVEVARSALLRELEHPAPSPGNARVPLAVWALAIGRRKIRAALRAEPPPAAAQRRAGEAAEWSIPRAAP
ncbi:hypothetical protein WME76_17005 [Sorangium sp. So ce119]|uniref:hypothetical protein n=1 Tax=Sorangium sp. So ce119 TaxID=3133279 RepID=UPI003F620913